MSEMISIPVWLAILILVCVVSLLFIVVVLASLYARHMRGRRPRAIRAVAITYITLPVFSVGAPWLGVQIGTLPWWWALVAGAIALSAIVFLGLADLRAVKVSPESVFPNWDTVVNVVNDVINEFVVKERADTACIAIRRHVPESFVTTVLWAGGTSEASAGPLRCLNGPPTKTPAISLRQDSARSSGRSNANSNGDHPAYACGWTRLSLRPLLKSWTRYSRAISG